MHSEQINKCRSKYQQTSTNEDKYKNDQQISTTINKYQRNQHVSTNINKYQQI